MYAQMYSAPRLSVEERRANYHQVTDADRRCALWIADTLVQDVDALYSLGGLKRETSKRFGKAYGSVFTRGSTLK